MGMTMSTMGVHRERQEGLDERGEAPPAYVEGDKPPSLRSDDGITAIISNEDNGNDSGTSNTQVVAAEGGDNNVVGHDTSRSASRLSAENALPTATSASNLERDISTGDSSTQITSIVESNQDVELRSLSRSTSTYPPLEPPTYFETLLGERSDLARPVTAVTAHDRFASTRRLMSESRNSS